MSSSSENLNEYENLFYGVLQEVKENGVQAGLQKAVEIDAKTGGGES
jgi:hypothetical protein